MMAATSYPNSTDQMAYQEDPKEALEIQRVYRNMAHYIINKRRIKAPTVNEKENHQN